MTFSPLPSALPSQSVVQEVFSFLLLYPPAWLFEEHVNFLQIFNTANKATMNTYVQALVDIYISVSLG